MEYSVALLRSIVSQKLPHLLRRNEVSDAVRLQSEGLVVAKISATAQGMDVFGEQFQGVIVRISEKGSALLQASLEPVPVEKPDTAAKLEAEASKPAPVPEPVSVQAPAPEPVAVATAVAQEAPTG